MRYQARALDPPRPVLVVRLLRGLAEVSFADGNIEAARAWYLKGLALLPETKSKKEYDQAALLLAFAKFNNAVGEPTEALAYAEEALEVYASEDDEASLAEAHTIAAQALRALGRPERALVHAQAARKSPGNAASVDSVENDESLDTQ